MSRSFGRCIHCCDRLDSPDFRTCSRCAGLVREAGSDDEPETEQARRERFHAARVEHIKQSFERGRRCLLARALDPADQSWAAPQPR